LRSIFVPTRSALSIVVAQPMSTEWTARRRDELIG